MALNITINKVAVAASFAAGTKVANIVVSGGTYPYAYELATGGDYFQINGTEVQVKANMNINNIQSFSVTVTDSTSGTALTATSDVVYPNIQAAIQHKFNSANKIYKITKDIDLGNGVLTVPEGCTLDFQGGSFSNGVIIGNNTKTFNANFINCPVSGTWSEHVNNYISRLDFPYYTNVTYIKGRYLNENTGNKTTYWLTTIPHKDENGNLIKLKVGLANDNKNSELNTAESTVLFAQRHRATYCSNSFLFNTSTNIPVGSLVVNGEILLDNGFPESPTRKCKALGIKADNTLISINAEETGYAQKALDNGCTDMIQGWYPFVLDGELYLEGRTEDDYHPRSAIGQKADKSLVFLQCNGRTKDDEGLNLRAMGNILIQEGCVFAYNLDGGGSTSGVYRGIKLNGNIDSLTFDREVSGFLYITKETDYSYDNQLVDAYTEIQKSRDIANRDLVEFRRATRMNDDVNKVWWNGWYSIGGSMPGEKLNLPQYTNGTIIPLGILLHFVDGDGGRGNSVDYVLDKDTNQLLMRWTDSAGNAGIWKSATCPETNSLSQRSLKGCSTFYNFADMPLWWNGKEWITAMGTTNYSKLGEFHAQPTYKAEYGSAANLPAGVYRVPDKGDGPAGDLLQQYLINFRWEKEDSTNKSARQFMISKVSGDIYTREIEASGNVLDWTVANCYAASKDYRPTRGKIAGLSYFDTTVGSPIWWDGSKWVNANGYNADIKTYGTFSQKPLSSDGIKIGFEYFCTDKQTTEGATNGIMIYHKGNDIWVDALGRVVV